MEHGRYASTLRSANLLNLRSSITKIQVATAVYFSTPYLLLNPFRLLVTVKAPFDSADNLIQ